MRHAASSRGRPALHVCGQRSQTSRNANDNGRKPTTWRKGHSITLYTTAGALWKAAKKVMGRPHLYILVWAYSVKTLIKRPCTCEA